MAAARVESTPDPPCGTSLGQAGLRIAYTRLAPRLFRRAEPENSTRPYANGQFQTQTVIAMPQARIAKLTPPRIKHCLPRPRLFALLGSDDGAIAQATWIHGPPGSGKTTLAASYLEQQKLKPVWFKVDADDREPSTFFHYLSQAVRAASGTRRLALPAIEPATRTDWCAYTRRFARALFAALPSPSVLVFDNLQEGGDMAGELVAMLVEEQPDNCRLLLISHRAPPASLAGAIAKRQLSVIAGDALSFDKSEAPALAASLGVGKRAEVERICEAAQGWAAGIVLLAGEDRKGAHAGDGRSAPLPIADYMARHVVDHLPKAARDVLLKCAFFADFGAALACSASGNPRAGEIVAALHRDGFLVERRGSGAAKVYSLHSLLAQALRDRCGEPGTPERRQAESEAGRHLAQQGRAEQSIALLLAGETFEEAARHILNVAKDMLATGRAEQLAHWIAALPEDVQHRSPWLGYWRAVATASFDEFEARRVFRVVFDRFAEDGDRVGMVLSAATALSAIDTSWLSYAGIGDWVKALDDAWTPDLALPDDEAKLRTISGALVAIVHGSSLRDQAERFIQPLPDLLAGCGDSPLTLDLALYAGYLVLDHYRVLREYERGLLFINLVDSSIPVGKANPLRVAHWLLSVSMFETAASAGMQRADLRARAQQRRKQAAALAERHALVAMRALLAHTEAEAAIQLRDADAASAALDAVERILLPGMSWQLAWQHSRRARIALLRSDPSTALDHIGKAIGYARKAEAPAFAYAPYHQTSAIGAAWLGDYNAALGHIKAAIEPAGDGLKRVFRLTEKLIAALREARTRDTNAVDDADAIREFLQTLHDERINEFGNLMRPLIAEVCAEALRRGVLPDIARATVTQRRLMPPASAAGHWPWPVKLEVLGGFSVSLWDEPLTFSGKSQMKPIEMLKLLVARSNPLKPGKALDIGSAIAELWPDADTKNPKGLFDITLHRLRKLLQTEEAVLVSEGQLRLNTELVWCDAFAFEIAAAAVLADDTQDPGTAIALYGGSLFGNDETMPWAYAAGERLATRFNLLVERSGSRLEARGDYKAAIDVYERGIARNTMVEPFYRSLMRCHLARGDVAEAVRSYRRCRDLLANVMGLKPAPETENLLRGIERV
jgi:LuxR family transcriptional regulator, maltose regulon positive regulatory protein